MVRFFVRRLVPLLFAALVSMSVLAPTAKADNPNPTPPPQPPPTTCNAVSGHCRASAQTSPTPATVHEGKGRPSGRSGRAPAKSRADSAAAIERKFKREVAAYQAALEKQAACEAGLIPGAAREANWCPLPSRPTPPDARLRLVGNPGKEPSITPEQAAYLAVAQLQLPINAPGVGPDPDKNRWKMAAVGFPYWLWAEGPTHVGPVSQKVANLSVSLDARISKTVFRMGDGHTVTCAGAGTRYPSWVEAGTKSPSCGYRYTKPSLPKGDYTVSVASYWAVTWHVNGATGVITVPRRGTAQLPVGELQVLVR